MTQPPRMRTQSDLVAAYARHLNEVIGIPPELTEHRIAMAREKGLIAEVDAGCKAGIPDDEFDAMLQELIEDTGPEIERARQQMQAKLASRRRWKWWKD